VCIIVAKIPRSIACSGVDHLEIPWGFLLCMVESGRRSRNGNHSVSTVSVLVYDNLSNRLRGLSKSGPQC